MTGNLNRLCGNPCPLLVVFAWWLPIVCLAGEPALSRTLQTSNDSGRESNSSSSSWSANTSSGIDFLVAAFFLIAAGWLVLALIYSVLVMIVVRLRARGQLDVYDENFGRLYLLGARCYIPLGFLLRRYVVAMSNEGREGNAATVRLMSREERRIAMELLLTPDEETMQDRTELQVARHEEEAVRIMSNETGLDDIDHSDQASRHAADEAEVDEEQLAGYDSDEEQVCAICLAEYGTFLHARIPSTTTTTTMMARTGTNFSIFFFYRTYRLVHYLARVLTSLSLRVYHGMVGTSC